MKTIIVFLPKEFNCYPKFERKIEKICSSFDAFTLAMPSDPNNLATRFQNKHSTQCLQLALDSDWQKSNFSHAIFFDDGEVFNHELNLIKEMRIPFRVIKIQITRVINIHVETSYSNSSKTDKYEYIGRGSKWGNPYSMFGHEQENREDVIHKFKYDFEKNLLLKAQKEDVYALAGKRLGCFCKPLACHGDVLANFLNTWDDGL